MRSGACTRFKSTPTSNPFSSITGLTNFSIVPGETVDSITIIAPLRQTFITSFTASITKQASTFLLNLSYGVGTETI